MSNRRVKDIGYDDADDAADYDGDIAGQEDELSPEQKEQMRQATIEVKAKLGSEYQPSEAEIQEALWYYYFDVDSSVNYLKGPTKSKQSKPKKKEESRFDKAAAAAAQKTGKVYPYALPLARSPLSMDFFQDTPWGRVPQHRIGGLFQIPTQPLGGLLGGTSKPSKLAILAAARKKKEEEKRQSETGTTPEESSRTISLLDRLGSKKDIGRPSAPTLNKPEQRRAEPEQPTFTVPARAKRQSSHIQEAPVKPTEASEVTEPPPKRRAIQDLRAPPSAFAQALLGYLGSDGGAVLDLQSAVSTNGPLRSLSFTLPFLDSVEQFPTSPFAGPSPDDIVLAAQSKAKNLNAKPSSSKDKASVSGLSEDVAALSMKEPTKIKHKNLDVLKEFEKANIKNSASFVVIGHVDHGKSTLMGRLLYDLKVIDERTMEKLRRESHKIGKASFALAWVMDATSDERARGVTVDTATSFFETEKTKFTILDAPGHQDFIPNMIAGASQADFAVLVIDAGTNSFESGLRGQTKEHALLVRSMAVQRLIVAINKMDKVDWSQERFTEIEQQMSAFLMSANFSPKTISFIPCAGLTGENILTAPTSATASWYKGPTLVQELDNAEPTKRALQRPLRLTISEVYRGTGTSASTVSVAGRLDSGSLQVGDTVQIQPSAETAVIKSVEADNRAADWAVAGQIVSLNIGGIDPAHVRHGDIVCHPQDVVKNVKSFKAKILTFDHVMPMFVTVHRGPLHAPGKIAKLVATLDKSSGEIVKKGPRVVQPGSVARVLVELENDMPLEAGWRVVLRADGTSLAAGLVE